MKESLPDALNGCKELLDKEPYSLWWPFESRLGAL